MPDNINRIITDFVNFDVENDYYQNEMKDDIVRSFKKILYEDDSTVRQWLEALFASSKALADEYDLIAKEGEAEEIPTEEPEDSATEEMEDAAEEMEDAGEEMEDAAEEMEDATQEESTSLSPRQRYHKIASNLLYE